MGCSSRSVRRKRIVSAVLNAVFESYRRSLLGKLTRIVQDRQIAEDLTQETYLRVRRAAESGPIDHIEAFLHRTARNLALDHLRRTKRRAGMGSSAVEDGAIDDLADDRPSAEEALIERQTLTVLSEAMARLPQRARLVLTLSRVEDWPNTKIAAHLGISERTVFNDLKLALGHCRDAMARVDKKENGARERLK